MIPLVSICLGTDRQRQPFGRRFLGVSSEVSRGSPTPAVSVAPPRHGTYANWNTCLQKARGEFVYIATSADTALPTLLERLVPPLQRWPEISLAACDFQDIDEHSRPLDRTGSARTFFGPWLDVPSICDGKTECLLHACFGGPTRVTMTSVLFRRQLVQDGLWFRTDRGSIADLEWAMRASLASDIAFGPGRLATWRIHDAQATQGSPRIILTQSILACVESVLGDPGAGVPRAWTPTAGGVDEILAMWRREYRHGFGLFRGELRRHPLRFLQGIWAAAGSEPRYLLRQMLRGFAWPERDSVDRCAVALNVSERLNASWPPRKVADVSNAPDLPSPDDHRPRGRMASDTPNAGSPRAQAFQRCPADEGDVIEIRQIFDAADFAIKK